MEQQGTGRALRVVGKGASMLACGEHHPGGGPGDDKVVTLRPGVASDAGFAATLHASAISGGFLSSLGPRFLRRLYRRITMCPDSFLIIGEAGDRRIGFIAGSMATGRLYRRFLLLDGLVVAAIAPTRMLSSWPRVLETLRHGRSEDDDAAEPELLATAVEPAFRGRRAGRQLVDAFLVELGSRGAVASRVVVGDDNEAAIALYRGAGFERFRSYELHEGTSSLVLRWEKRPSS